MRRRGCVTRYRYRLQRKEQWVIPNVLGNHSMPVYSWRWKDIYASDDYDSLADIMKEIVAKGCGNLYRIEDTEGALKDAKEAK